MVTVVTIVTMFGEHGWSILGRNSPELADRVDGLAPALLTEYVRVYGRIEA